VKKTEKRGEKKKEKNCDLFILLAFLLLENVLLPESLHNIIIIIILIYIWLTSFY